jgi:PAS domain S-box-containing protein
MIDPGSREGKVVGRSFPTDDLVLAERVQELLRRERRKDPARIAAGIETQLRAVYPNVRVSLRDDVAGFGDAMIYVFRDGSASRVPDPQSWIEDEATARAVTDANGVYVEANEAAARLFGRSVESIIGATAGTFTRADSRIEDRGALWRMLQQTGRLHSRAIVCAEDGSETRVEFITLKDADGPDRHVTYLRERH